MPGYSSNKIKDLSPKFEKKVKKLITSMEKRGYAIRISQTFRSQERQQFLYDASLKMKELTGIELKVTSTTNSRHTHTIDGNPAACAIDIRPRYVYSSTEKVLFYKLMKIEAQKLGLRSGVDFRRKTEFQKKHNIGWDPGHIYSKNCT